MRRVLIAVLCVGLGLPVAAEVASPVKVAALSARLFAAGVEAEDPLLIAAAARLRKSIAPVRTDRMAIGGVAVDAAPLSWEEMLGVAASFGSDDPVVMALLSDVADENDRGVASGPVYNIGSLGNGQGDIYPPITFRGGEYAEVYVEAKAATNLNLAVLDDRGRLVCSDTDISPIAYCGWTPATGGTFTLKVDNKGPAAADYALMTN